MRERKERENKEEKERFRVRARLKERDVEGAMLHSHVEQFSDKDLNVRAESDSQHSTGATTIKFYLTYSIIYSCS